MLAKEIISDVIPAVRPSDAGIKALNWMEIFRISHLPIVENDEFLGLISDTDIYDLNQVEDTIESHNLSLFRPYVFQNQHLYEVISLAAGLNLSIIPVLDEKMKYTGVITLYDLVHEFAKLSAVESPGAIFTLELNLTDYSLTQIAQIIEGNDAKVLSMYLNNVPDSTKIEITIKINKVEFSGIRQTFERYDYVIKSSFSDNDIIADMIEERYEEFMNYLNI